MIVNTENWLVEGIVHRYNREKRNYYQCTPSDEYMIRELKESIKLANEALNLIETNTLWAIKSC